jgi:hypothetical protein
MTSPLRSFQQFVPLERKLRGLQRAGGSWQAAMKTSAAAAYLDYQEFRKRAEDQSGSTANRDLLGESLRLALSPGQVAPYMLDDVIQFQEKLSGRVVPFRTAAGRRVSAGHEPLAAELVPVALERLIDWLNSPAFADMHPIERMTLCQVRLYEIWPYETGSGLVADLFAVRVLHGATGIVPWPVAEDISEFYAALSEAFGFATKRLVEFHLKACERACDEVMRRL